MACAKKAYPNKAAAERRAANHAREVGYALYAYRCRSCLKWHLTKKRPAKRSFKSKLSGVRRRRS